MTYLGVDYGKRKIGLALSEGLIASPLFVIEISSLTDATAKVKKIIDLYKIDCLIVGLPDSGEARSITEKFINQIKNDIQVITVDETLSSYNAKELMVSMQLSRKNRQTEDSFAASLLLQNYLDSQKA